MDKLNVLLVCGSGASSGFMAANIRKAASSRGIDIVVNARSESEIANYVEDINCLLVGPHLASEMDYIKEDLEGYEVKLDIIDKKAYSKLDGEMVLDQILKMFE